MNKLMKRIVLAVLAGMMTTAVQAANLNINGIVVASPCIVDTAREPRGRFSPIAQHRSQNGG
ncbi:Uncharacterised protein [Serratia fonticola]|uniref:P pilus assembly protein, pilin FimA n=1 Tax=Serratia fonticola TaxID=47917 RepID=A0A4U9WKG7_SERFO|nr:Uncharacterised protein [Serratia fonticola]